MQRSYQLDGHTATHNHKHSASVCLSRQKRRQSREMNLVSGCDGIKSHSITAQAAGQQQRQQHAEIKVRKSKPLSRLE